MNCGSAALGHAGQLHWVRRPAEAHVRRIFQCLLVVQEAQVVGGEGRHWHRLAVVSVLQDDGEAARRIREDLEDALLEKWDTAISIDG